MVAVDSPGLNAIGIGIVLIKRPDMVGFSMKRICYPHIISVHRFLHGLEAEMVERFPCTDVS